MPFRARARARARARKIASDPILFRDFLWTGSRIFGHGHGHGHGHEKDEGKQDKNLSILEN